MSEPLTREVFESWLLDITEEACIDDNQYAGILAHDAAQRERLATVEQQLASMTQECDNHRESLVAIASMTDGGQMKQWANESLSGYTGSRKSIILSLQQQLASMGQERDLLNRDNHRLREQLDHTNEDCHITSERIIAIEDTLRARYPKLQVLSSMWLGFIEHATTIMLDDIADLTAQLAAKEADVQHAAAIIHGLLPLAEITEADVAWVEVQLKDKP